MVRAQSPDQPNSACCERWRKMAAERRRRRRRRRYDWVFGAGMVGRRPFRNTDEKPCMARCRMSKLIYAPLNPCYEVMFSLLCLTPTTHKRLPLDTQLTYNTHIHAEFLSRGVCPPCTTGLNYLSWTLCSVSVARRDEMIFMEPLGQGWGRRREAKNREGTKTYMFVYSAHNG